MSLSDLRGLTRFELGPVNRAALRTLYTENVRFQCTRDQRVIGLVNCAPNDREASVTPCFDALSTVGAACGLHARPNPVSEGALRRHRGDR